MQKNKKAKMTKRVWEAYNATFHYVNMKWCIRPFYPILRPPAIYMWAEVIYVFSHFEVWEVKHDESIEVSFEMLDVLRHKAIYL